MAELKPFDSYMDSGDIASRAGARYDLSPEELRLIEVEVIDFAREKFGAGRVCALWISPTHRYADFIRTHEKSYFPEVEIDDETENNEVDEEENGSVYLALVDTREDVGRIVHGADITGLKSELITGEITARTDNTTGFYTVDSLIALGNFSADDFYAYHANKGIDLDKCFSVETNFRIGNKTPKYKGFGTAELTYRALFQLLEKIDARIGNSVFFASMNRVQRLSLNRVGIEFEPLMGMDNLVTEESLTGIDSLPVSIKNNNATQQILSSIIDLPEAYIRQAVSP